jgi:hypothetical protein
MATLADVSSVSRKVIKWGLVSIVVLSFIPVLFRVIKKSIVIIKPAPPPAPTVKYGKLPKLAFPVDAGDWPEFTLETIEGRLPSLPNMSKVFPVEINKSRLLSLQRITPKAMAMGFSNAPIEIDDQRYKFIHPKYPAELLINLVYGTVNYQYEWSKAEDVIQTKNVPAGTAAVGAAKGFWGQLVALPKDIVGGSSKIQYLAVKGNSLVNVESVYDANLVRVDLFRTDMDGARVVTPGGTTSPVFVLISSITQDMKKVLLADYQYSNVFEEEFSTYPLRSIDQAWKDLQEKRAHIAIRTVPKVIVRKASLGYYESASPQQFMQPVYIFEGDGGFMAYVPAVDPSYLQEEIPAN